MSKTLKDIAAICNVSVATVSKVVNDKTYDLSEETISRVKKVLIEENYVPNMPARFMKTNKTNSIGLIIPDIRNPFFTEIARGAEDVAYKRGYDMLLSNSDNSQTKELNYIESFQSKRLDGILLVGSNDTNHDHEHKVNISVPIVAIDRDIFYNNVVSIITTDNYHGGYLAGKHLSQFQSDHYFYIGSDNDNAVSNDRLAGFKSALTKNLDKYMLKVFKGEFSYEYGYEIGRRENFPIGSSVFCGNDMIAFGVINALQQKEISVGEQVYVVGFDDIRFSEISSPPLTTIRQPSYDMGAKAATILIDSIENKKISDKYMLEQIFVKRQSS